MNMYIHKLIKEQFSISDLDFSDDEYGYDVNIFNKNYNHPYYKKVLDGTVTENEIKELNSLVSVAVPKDKSELQKIIKLYSKRYPEYSLNWLCVFEITDMSHLFEKTKYNGDINMWDTSNVSDMSYMFYKAYDFNRPIGEWDVSNVTDMCCMFSFAHEFNQPINSWVVSSVTNMRHMFYRAHSFNQSISEWDVSSVTDMKYMFSFTYNFNQDISIWNISNKADTYEMFYNCLIKEEYKPEKCR